MMPKILDPDTLWTSDSPATLHRNIEVKAKCADLAGARRRAISLGARPAGRLDQTDIYFHVRHGRLKLRETRGKPATLIAYTRPNRSTARDSRYRVVPVPDAAALKAALAGSIGIKSIVRKRRELLMHRNVRIHLDRVAGLGTFLELEAVVGPAGNARVSRRRIDELIAGLVIRPMDRISKSYSDLMLAGRERDRAKNSGGP